MGNKDSVVFPDASPDPEARLSVAVSRAQANGARLLGVDVSPPSTLEGQWRNQAVALEDTFEGRLGRIGAELRVPHRGPSDGEREALLRPRRRLGGRDSARRRGVGPDAVRRAGGGSALGRGAHVDPAARLAARARQGESLPYLEFEPRGNLRRLDVLPILTRGRKVALFASAPRADTRDSDVALIAGHLLRHEVRVEVYTWPAMGHTSAMSAPFAYLNMQKDDRIVAGYYYGHSRWMARLFGGVSQDFLHQPVMPTALPIDRRWRRRSRGRCFVQDSSRPVSRPGQMALANSSGRPLDVIPIKRWSDRQQVAIFRTWAQVSSRVQAMRFCAGA